MSGLLEGKVAIVTGDRAEGVTALLEGRRPKFTGR